MKLFPTTRFPFRRRREGKTDYKARLALLKSETPQLVVRKSLNRVTAQIVEYDKIGDKTKASATSSDLKKFGWNYNLKNLPSSYLLGLLIGKKAIKSGIKEAVLNSGLQTLSKGNKIYAVLKGAVDAGLKIPYSQEILPSEDRIKGKHISSHNKKFDKLPSDFETVKKKILESK